MELIIKSESGEPLTTSAAVAEGTGNQHKNVIALIRQYLDDFETFGRVAFETRPFGTAGGEQAREVAMLNEPQATLLITYLRNSEIVRAFKQRLVKAFYDAKAIVIPTTLSGALRLAAEQAELIEQQQAALAAAAPKIEFAEAVRNVDGLCTFEEIAKALGVGRNKLISQLKSAEVLQDNRLPYQCYIDRGYFEVVELTPWKDSSGASHPCFGTRITGAGQVWLSRRFAPSPSTVRH